MGRARSLPTFEWLAAPLDGREKQIDSSKRLVEWCMDDPGPKIRESSIRQADHKVQARFENLPRPNRIVKAVQILESDMSHDSLEWVWAKNEVDQRGFDSTSEDQRKLVFLVANGCATTNSLIESLSRNHNIKEEKHEGMAFGKAWKDLMEICVGELGYDKVQSYKMFDSVFDNPKILRLLGERKRLRYINGIEAEMAAFWLLKDMGMENVRFGSEADDQDNKVDLIADNGNGKTTFYQVKVRQGRHDFPQEYDVLDANSFAECGRSFERTHDNVDEIRKFRASMGIFRDFAESMRRNDEGEDLVGAVVFFMPIRLDKVVERARAVPDHELQKPRVAKRVVNAISLSYAE
ncbi:hypothetical protein HYV64_00250 [Candidatus Shapirobacteria bacterium]|nr:hypothetical protein [Candidatus Shapirobacteria bacterium]